MILFGRSMGSGPAAYLSAKKRAHSMLLISPYTSIKDASKSTFGWAKFLSVIVTDMFRNIDQVSKCKCPVFFLHGRKDTMIPVQHSIDLHKVCPMFSEVKIPELMNHNDFKFVDDLITPFISFLKKIDP
mmetsp:Transcript_96441/g.132796  ORF Transcript_96441/g.132796 Transcript_96441/m.132796 type:complete len:129 (+) Transcript_96441:109-495(+)